MTNTNKSVNLKENQPWIFFGRTDVEAEAPILWPPNVKSWLIGKDPDDGKDWRQEEKGDDRGGDSWMASLTQWTWVWASSRSWWWTGKSGVLQSIGLQSWTGLSNWTTSLHFAFPEARDRWAPVEEFTNSPLIDLKNASNSGNRVNSRFLSLVNTSRE